MWTPKESKWLRQYPEDAFNKVVVLMESRNTNVWSGHSSRQIVPHMFSPSWFKVVGFMGAVIMVFLHWLNDIPIEESQIVKHRAACNHLRHKDRAQLQGLKVVGFRGAVIMVFLHWLNDIPIEESQIVKHRAACNHLRHKDRAQLQGLKMDVNSFYGKRMRTLQALVPENPQESDADFSDVDDPIEDPDYHPIRDEAAGDSSFESLDEDDAPSKSTSSTELPCKKRRKGKHTLKTVSLQEPEDTLSSPSSPPSGPHNGTRKIWKHEDIEEFQVTESRFEPPVVVQSPFQYFKMLFTDEMIQHVAHQTNLYSAQELGDPIKTSPEEIEDFLAMLLFMGVFNFPSLEDYWHHESRFSVIADIMPRKRFQLLRRYIHFNDNQQCSENPDRFYKIRPLFEMLRKQCLLIPSTYKHSVDEVMIGYKGL
ncbi:piggyBac transposable element-derived 3-like protein [Labeo rohita]|uniref:PiggyBac transposable element-derived 3-like protein n=1 Tax=Labeo rohita TaxID=84645 RepID=A0A498P427_LABRO|nr:piggyBac transposable element-derived 3-like protein [Labeo rohita]